MQGYCQWCSQGEAREPAYAILTLDDGRQGKYCLHCLATVARLLYESQDRPLVGRPT